MTEKGIVTAGFLLGEKAGAEGDVRSRFRGGCGRWRCVDGCAPEECGEGVRLGGIGGMGAKVAGDRDKCRVGDWIGG